jgi:tetratricopeptide (TPR) repeat protein
MHRRGPILSVLTVLNFVALTVPAAAQWDWPEKAKNLKILPENTSAVDLRKTMIGFVQSLGVRCSHCHVGVEGRPLSEFDFVSDERQTKQTARIMLQMVRAINGSHLAKIDKTGSPRVAVTCVTCHRGVTQPRSLADILTETYRNSGTDSTMTAYRQLRDRYYGGFAYDFRATSLDEVADNLSNMEKTEDALKFLRLNVDFYPASVPTHMRLANMYKLLGEKAQAIAAVEKVLQLAPNHGEAKKLLEELKK